jgi:hypothetical protein
MLVTKMAKIDKIVLKRVYAIFRTLEPGVLYLSEEFETATHLCACGCGAKVSTPLGRMEWKFQEGQHGPTLRPSIGSGQRPCRSHYFIDDGVIHWAASMSDAQAKAALDGDIARRRAYYDGLRPRGIFGYIRYGVRKIGNWVAGLFD